MLRFESRQAIELVLSQLPDVAMDIIETPLGWLVIIHRLKRKYMQLL